jgi:hypothetical protein
MKTYQQTITRAIFTHQHGMETALMAILSAEVCLGKLVFVCRQYNLEGEPLENLHLKALKRCPSSDQKSRNLV